MSYIIMMWLLFIPFVVYLSTRGFCVAEGQETAPAIDIEQERPAPRILRGGQRKAHCVHRRYTETEKAAPDD